MNTITSRDFNQDTSGAKRAAEEGPVFITDRGQPAHVLLSITEYRRITGRTENIVDRISSAEAGAIDFEPGRLGTLYRPVDLS